MGSGSSCQTRQGEGPKGVTWNGLGHTARERRRGAQCRSTMMAIHACFPGVPHSPCHCWETEAWNVLTAGIRTPIQLGLSFPASALDILGEFRGVAPHLPPTETPEREPLGGSARRGQGVSQTVQAGVQGTSWASGGGRAQRLPGWATGGPGPWAPVLHGWDIVYISEHSPDAFSVAGPWV